MILTIYAQFLTHPAAPKVNVGGPFNASPARMTLDPPAASWRDGENKKKGRVWKTGGGNNMSKYVKMEPIGFDSLYNSGTGCILFDGFGCCKVDFFSGPFL